MKALATAPAEERGDVFRIAATERNSFAAIMEKDFWVCWTLQRLFSLPEIAPHLLFKGGTTLSKVYGAIDRFSEDIDISVSRDFIRPDAANAAEAPEISKTKRGKEIETLKGLFHQAVRTTIYPSLSTAIASELGGSGWALTIRDHDPGAIVFTYPLGASETLDYVRPEVLIEMGGRSDIWPAENARITPYVTTVAPHLFMDPEVSVRVLAAERTFWEKATILHNEYYRPPDKARGDRISRHYYDFVKLARHPEIGPRSRSRRDLLTRVVDHKTLYYSDRWSRYQDVLSGQAHLVPPLEAINTLRSDYAKMRDMFFNEPPSFEHIVEELARLEIELNAESK